MMLCLDSGNTRLKWGVYDGRQWVATGAVAHDDIDAFLPPDPLPEIVVGCNVAGAAKARSIEARLHRSAMWINATAMQSGVANGYEEPSTLGADRWAALIGARKLHSGAALVVLSGTATTIDVLDAQGRHQGGIILPGLAMMANALSRGTAALPAVEVGNSKALPRNTHDAIASGAMFATAGAIRRMFEQISGADRPLCLVSGGAAALLVPLLTIPIRHVEHLVLEGVAAIATAQT